MKTFKLAASAALIALMAMPALAASDGFDPNRYYGHMMGGYGYGFFGGAMMLVFWGVIIAIIVVAIRWLSDRDQKDRGSNALDILKERLARGEIEPEEYEARRKVLES